MSRDPSPEVSKFLGKLEGVRSNGVGWSARCPCRNDDQNPSLSVGQGDDGRVLVTCHRGNGCSVDEICAAMDLAVSDLMPPPAPKQKLTLVETYDYRDANGELLFQKQRFIDEYGKKTFRQRKKVAGEWQYSLGDTPKVLYNLPAVAQTVRDDGPIWVVEGEKDANTLIAAGYVATTMPGGAGKWLPLHTDTLAGARVGVVCDNDAVGREHAERVLRELSKAGCRVRGFQPPVGFKDITEMLQAGLTVSDLEDFTPEQAVSPAEASSVTVSVEVPADPFEEALGAITGLLSNGKLTVAQKIGKAHALLDAALFDTPPQRLEAVDWFDFVNEDVDDSYDWVIPGLLERTDRVIVVASEGAGKTTLARQVAICCAYGVHPFTKTRIPRIKTLTIDLENPNRIIRRKSKTIMDAAARYTRDRERPDARLVIKPSGLNLLKSEDRLAFETIVEQNTPDILFIGPLYKAFIDPGGRSSESVATEIIMYLDYIRETYQCAMWMEQHAPLAQGGSRDLRPFGSAVWSRWPEFGISLEKDLTATVPNTFKVGSFRGDRDERHWPSIVKWGNPGSLPFEVVEFRTAS